MLGIKDGGVIPMSITGSSLVDQEGNLQAIVIIARDMRQSKLIVELDEANKQLQQEIMKRKGFEQQLRNSHDALEKRVEERTRELQMSYQKLAHAGRLSSLGEMATGMAHEINQPLAGIARGLTTLSYLNYTRYVPIIAVIVA